MKICGCKIIEGAHEVFIKGNEKCFLIFHGFTGYPGEMEELGRYVNEKLGYTIYIPRLPGHGTCGEDFLSSSYRDWLRKAVDSYKEARAMCEEVFVGGLSMGGILSTIVAAALDVKKIALYAPAHLVYDQKKKFLAYFLSIFVKKTLRKEFIPFEEDLRDLTRSKLVQEYWRYTWIKPAKEFFKLQSIGKKLLEKVSSDTLVVVSKSDGSVPVEVVDLIETNIKGNMKKVVLEKSGHVVVRDVEKERVFEETVRWLS